jgi:hypothetical protein
MGNSMPFMELEGKHFPTSKTVHLLSSERKWNFNTSNARVHHVAQSWANSFQCTSWFFFFFLPTIHSHIILLSLLLSLELQTLEISSPTFYIISFFFNL